jgi:kynurenine formamidase
VRIVDLSQEIYHRRPVPGSQMPPAIWTHVTHEESAAQLLTMGLIMSDHCGTHVDAFTHLDPRPGAEAIHEIPLKRFYSSAICLDVSGVAAGAHITRADLEAALARSGQQIRKGDAVLLYSGHSRKVDPAEVGVFAGLDRQAAEWLADRGVNNIGTEAWSIDRRTPSEMPPRYPAHMVCRDRKMLNTENLAIPPELINRRFLFLCLPLKIRGATGSPVRAIAVLDDLA